MIVQRTIGHRLESIGHCTRSLNLDSLINPFSPAPAAIAAYRNFRELNGDASVARVRNLLAQLHMVNESQIVIGISPEWIKPTTLREGLQADELRVVASPDPETGAMLRIRDAVRLVRSSPTLVIDERAAGFAHRDHLPLYREFESVVLFRSLDAWLAPLGASFNYLLTKSPIDVYSSQLTSEYDDLTLCLAEATLANWSYVRAANRQVVRERAALFRALRKLNMVRPCPSSSCFVSATVERGDRAAMRSFLEKRDIRLHYPDRPDLLDRVRISAVSRHATSTLCTALIDWARTIEPD